MKNKELDERFENLKLEFKNIKTLKEKSELDSKYDLFLLDAHGYDVSKYQLTHQEKSDLKESLRLQYIALTDFNEKFLFWHNNQGSLQYEDSIYSTERLKIQAEKDRQYNENPNANHYTFDSTRLYEIQNLIDAENEAKGIIEPVEPSTDEEKAFVGMYWLNNQLKNRLKENSRIFDYQRYKEAFLNEVSQKGEIEYTQKEIGCFEGRINEKIKYQTSMVIYPDGSKLTLGDFFKDLTNNVNDYQVDFTLLYNCSKLHEKGFAYLYVYGSFLIPFNQCKRFLEAFIKNPHENLKANEDSIKKIFNSAVSFPQYLKIETPELFAEKLKNEFKVEKSKKIKLLIKSLQQENILILGERDLKVFLESMKVYFERDLGSYQSINDFKFNENKHKKDFEAISKRLESLIKECKK